MAEDKRGHTVPTGPAPARRQDLLDLSLSINDVVHVAGATAAAQALTDLGSSDARPLVVRREDTEQYLEHTPTAGWRVLTAPINTGAWSPSAAWELAPGNVARWHRQGPRCEIESTIVQRAASTLSISAGTDYTVSAALPSALWPSRPVYVNGSIYFGTPIPWLARVTVNTDGTVAFRAETGGTFGVGGANILCVPPMSWVQDT